MNEMNGRKFLQEQIAGSPDNEIAILTEEFRTSPRIYGYLFGETEPYDDVYREAVAALGTAMTSSSGPVRESTTPAGFTYLGQFIAHDLTRARATGVRDQEPFDDAGGDEHEVTRDLRERVRADQRSVLVLEIVRCEKDLDDDSQRGADQKRREPEDDGQLRIRQTAVSNARGARDDP